MVGGGWSGLKERAEYLKEIGETFTALNSDVFARFFVQTDHCTRCTWNTRHSRQLTRSVSMPDAPA